jgi:beta-glucosidase/6-phospho-beta-glucosidase/beta-galactosidase
MRVRLATRWIVTDQHHHVYIQALEDKYKGWLGRGTVDAYAAYVDTVFDRLGDKIKFWITFNEP